MRVLFSVFGKRRENADGPPLERALSSAATLARRRLVAASELRDTFQLCRNRVDTKVPYQELKGLLAVNILTGSVLPCAPAEQATKDTSAIVERLGEAAL
ncbi:hypothetical protein [Bradyrhizobium cosmicum]|uniref:hypothetical protein n=1 Tax=Bradyrhizobium cosmicum TaxID=1404864 RepID=UPI0028EAF9C0|nr:hypothetical protein [Bradyrhizobium cosmicum]